MCLLSGESVGEDDLVCVWDRSQMCKSYNFHARGLVSSLVGAQCLLTQRGFNFPSDNILHCWCNGGSTGLQHTCMLSVKHSIGHLLQQQEEQKVSLHGCLNSWFLCGGHVPTEHLNSWFLCGGHVPTEHHTFHMVATCQDVPEPEDDDWDLDPHQAAPMVVQASQGAYFRRRAHNTLAAS